MSVLDLVRPDLRDFAGYASARRSQAQGAIWLNANESPLPSPADPGGRLNRYPEPQPTQLRARLAELYGVAPAALMVTRGSDEGIDLLVRAFCRAGVDAVAIATPCFGMYAVSARLQGAPLVEVPLRDAGLAWAFDLPGLVDAVAARGARIVFLCSPANPTGQYLALHEIRQLAQDIGDRAILVVDEAYVEYAATGSAATLLEAFPNLVVLRTLSKAHALAGARIGALLANPAIVALLRNLSAPYPIAATSAALALEALSDGSLAQTRRRVADTVAERGRVAAALQSSEGLSRLQESQGNFLLLRCADAQASLDALLAAGVVVRDMRAMPGLGDALRVSIGTPAENDAVLRALGVQA
jgi:histidinol-phosphate aminotransferase